jgi:Cytochrome C oxidase, cbb3-type, subunit III
MASCPSRARRVSRCLALGLSYLGVIGAHADESSRVFDANCALCHQIGGVGLKGQFPRLAGRVGDIVATADGRRYLTEVVLFGMAGKIDVDGASIVGVMPSFAALSNDDLASALNYVARLESSAANKSQGPLLAAFDLRTTRSAEQLSPTQVNARRQSIPALSGMGAKAK